MQLRFVTDLSADEYVRRQAWENAKLDSCPLHPEGECGFAKHGTYKRKMPIGVEIARWYCSEGHQSFSLLPDCLSSRISGSLFDVETVIDQVEKSPSQNVAADKICLDIELPGALRWIRRRLFLVNLSLTMLIAFLPSLFKDCLPSINCFRNVLAVEQVLPELRKIADSQLYLLSPPLGFGPFPKKKHFQQRTGADPPAKVL